MGTLHDQPIRNYRFFDADEIQGFVATAKRIADEEKVNVSDVLKAWEIKERERANTMSADAGNVWDEQISGIGEVLSQISNSLDDIAERIAPTLDPNRMVR